MNSNEDTNKIINILNGESKFKIVNSDIVKLVLKIEDKISRFLR